MENNQSRYTKVFRSLEQQHQIAWIPFIMLGYPDLKSSVKYIETFIENGADALEIGIPFSDPVADGPLIQESARVALENGTTVKGCLNAIAELRKKYTDIPIGLLMYANLVYRPGLSNFYNRCHTAGVDSVLIADVPLLEAKPFVVAANSAKVDAIFIAPPNASDETLKTVSKQTGGYTYVVSRPGVTGDNTAVEYPEKVISSLLEYQAPSPVLGFGISKPEHVTKAISLGFKGVISGSAITRIISSGNETVINDLKEFSQKMKSATAVVE